jgi:hypothetical protein
MLEASIACDVNVLGLGPKRRTLQKLPESTTNTPKEIRTPNSKMSIRSSKS